MCYALEFLILGTNVWELIYISCYENEHFVDVNRKIVVGVQLEIKIQNFSVNRRLRFENFRIFHPITRKSTKRIIFYSYFSKYN